jgi:hypothetical protein
VRLIEHVGALWHRLWTVRLAIGGAVFWGAVAGLYLVWPAFAGVIPLWFYALGGIVMSIALVVARILKQPGLDQ